MQEHVQSTPQHELRSIPLTYEWVPISSQQGEAPATLVAHPDELKALAEAEASKKRDSTPPASPQRSTAIMSPSIYEYSPGDLDNKLSHFAAGSNWFSAYQESQVADQNSETPRRSTRPRQLFGTPSPLTSPTITSPTKFSNGRPPSAKKSATRASKKRSRIEAAPSPNMVLNVTEDAHMEPKSPSKRPIVEMVNLDSSVSEIGENSVHERDASFIASPDRSVEIQFDMPLSNSRKFKSSSNNVSMNEEDSRDDENNRSLALSDIQLPATLPPSLQPTLPLEGYTPATMPLSPGPFGSPPLATLPLPSDTPSSPNSLAATLPLPSDPPSTLPATLPVPPELQDESSPPASPIASPPFVPTSIDTQSLSKVATQAAYDEDAFLAQFSTEYEKSRNNRPAPRSVPPIPFTVAEDIETSQEPQNDDMDAHNESQAPPSSFLAQSSTTLKSVLFAPQQPSFVDSLLQSASRAASKKRSIYSVRPTDTSRFQSQRLSSTNTGATWSSVSYSLVESSVADCMVDGERPIGVITYDPDFEPVDNDTGRSDGLSAFDDYEEKDYEGDFMQFGLNSQLPTQAMRRKGTAQQSSILMQIDDSDPISNRNNVEDPIDDIESSQEAMHMSTRVNPVDLEDELIREQYTPMPSQSFIALPSATQLDSSQTSRSRFLPSSSTASITALTQSQLPSSQFALTQSQSTQIHTQAFRGAFQPAKRASSSKTSKKTKKRHTAERRFQYGLATSEEIEEEEQVFLAPIVPNRSMLDGSMFDADRSEAIEEFSAAEVRSSTVAAAYEPYKLVAKAAAGGASTPTANPTFAVPQKPVGPQQRHFVLPGSPASNFHPPAIGTAAWLSSLAMPDWSSSDPLVRLGAENGNIELQPVQQHTELSLVVLLTSNISLEGSHQLVMAHVIHEDQNNPESKPVSPVLLVFSWDANASAPPQIAPGNVIRFSNLQQFSYEEGIGILWPFHKVPASSSTAKKEMSSITVFSLLYSKGASLLPMAETALLLSGQPDIREVRERYASAVVVTPPASFGNLNRPKSIHASGAILPTGPSSRPFILPNALPTSSAVVPSVATLPTFTRQRYNSSAHLYRNNFGFTGHLIESSQQVLLLAVFARPSLSFKSSQAPSSVSNLSTNHFRQNWSQSVANLEESARLKRAAFYQRASRPFFISSLKTDQQQDTESPIGRTALAWLKSSKNLVWIDFDFDGAVPGTTWNLTLSHLRQYSSTSSLNIHTLVEDAMKMFGVTTEEVFKSFTSEVRSRLTVNPKQTTGETFFPSSQESEMDVDDSAVNASKSTVEFSHPVLSCCIPRVSLPDKHCRVVGSTRSLDDRLLQLAPEGEFVRPRRVSLLGLVTSALEPQITAAPFKPNMMHCTVAFKNSSVEVASLSLPSYLLPSGSLSDPISFDHLLQLSANSFMLDGFSQLTCFATVEGIPGVRALQRGNPSWYPQRLQCATGEMIKYKEMEKASRGPLANWKKKLAEGNLMSSYDASVAGNWPSSMKSHNHNFVCANRHTNLVLLPSTWRSELFPAVELPDYLGYCRSCFSIVTPIPAQ